jgi:hypothetical protein
MVIYWKSENLFTIFNTILEIGLERVSLLLRKQSQENSSLLFCNLQFYECLFMAHTDTVLKVLHIY